MIEYTRRNRNQILKYFRPFYQGLKWVRIMEKMEAENLVTNFLGLDPTCCVILHNPNLQFNPTNLPYTYNPIILYNPFIQSYPTVHSYPPILSYNPILHTIISYSPILPSYPTILSYNPVQPYPIILSYNPILQPYPIIISYNRNIVQPYPTILSYCTILSYNLYNPIQ